MTRFLNYIIILSAMLFVYSCGEKTAPEKEVVSEVSEPEKEVVSEVNESLSPIIGEWISKTANGEKWEEVNYIIKDDNSLESTLTGKVGSWSLNDNEFCETFQGEKTCFACQIEGNKLTLTNELGWIFVYEKLGE